MKNGMLALCAALISAGIAADAQEWLGDGYANRMRLNLTEKAAAGNLENFPVCVRLNGDELFSKIKPDGSDLTFTSADGKTVLPHEIESMDAAKKELVCWVRLPVIQQKKETPFYLYFNNPGAQSKHAPGAVWSNGYLAVWHMNGKDSAPDSLGNFNLTLKSGAGTVPALIGTGVESTGGKAGLEYRYLRGEKAPVLPAGQSFTLSCWVNPRKNGGHFFYDYPVQLFYHPAKRWQVNFNKPKSVGAHSYLADKNPYNRWVNLSIVYDGGNKTLRLFVDGKPGELFKNADFPGLRAKSILSLMSIDALGDEFTLSNTARSPEWIAAAYENQKDSAAVSIGKIETR